MHALALKDKEEEHAGLLHTAGEIQVRHAFAQLTGCMRLYAAIVLGAVFMEEDLSSGKVVLGPWR